MKQTVHNDIPDRNSASVARVTAMIAHSQIVVPAAPSVDAAVPDCRLPEGYGAFDAAILEWIVAEGWRAAPGRQFTRQFN
jgi:hypothetical protein